MNEQPAYAPFQTDLKRKFDRVEQDLPILEPSDEVSNEEIRQAYEQIKPDVDFDETLTAGGN